MSLQCFLNPEWKSFFFFWFVFFSMWYQFRWKYFWSLLCQIFIVCDHNMIIILLKSIFSSTVIDTGISWLSIYPPLEFLYWKVYIFYVSFLLMDTISVLLTVQFSHSVVSDSLRPHESQHARPPCPLPTPGVYSNSCPSSQWCHPAIWMVWMDPASVIPFTSFPHSLPTSGSFPMSQLFTWGCQRIGFSFSISPSNEHPGLISFRMDWLDLLAVQGTLKSLLQHHSSKAAIFWHSAFFTVQLSHPDMTTGKTIALTRRTFVGKVMSLLFNMLSRLVITFLPRSKHLLISWLQSPS